MDEAERLGSLVAELEENAGYATGALRFPRTVSDEDGVAIANAVGDAIDEGTARRAEVAEASGHHIYCKDRCNDCCTILVMVYRPEAMLIARFLQDPDNAPAREAFLAAYPAWRAAAGDLPETAADLFVKGDAAKYDAEHMTHWTKNVMCAFNHDGRCVIYPVRPIGCRNAHALDTNARCRADSDRPAAAVAFLPLDEFIKKSTRLLRATHNASTNAARHRNESVCAAVYRLLTDAAG